MEESGLRSSGPKMSGPMTGETKMSGSADSRRDRGEEKPGENAGASLGLAGAIREKFGFAQKDLNTYSPLTLAFIGDSVYDLLSKTLVVEHANQAASRLHRLTSGLVKAAAQARMAEALKEELSEEERAVYRRGRNAKSYTMAKNASMADYRKATGLEALFGYLYLQDRLDRAMELMRRGLVLTGDRPWEESTGRTGRGE